MDHNEMRKAQEIAQSFLDEGFSPQEAARLTGLLFEPPEAWESARTDHQQVTGVTAATNT